jgi:FKBP-type peptidyl-prolyl cis-trans isomerase
MIARTLKKKAEDERKTAGEAGPILDLVITKAGDAVNYPKMGDSVACHYIASLPDGTVFDNSFDRAQPIYFVLGGDHVIPGFEAVVLRMCRGQRCKVTIPSEV